MKSRLVISFLITTLFFACSKERKGTQEVGVNQAAINQVINSKNIREQRLGYELLNPAEKFTIWNNKLIQADLNSQFTPEQTSFVNELLGYITPNAFLENSSENQRLMQMLDKITIKAIELFGYKEAGEFLANITSNKGGVTPNLVEEEPGEGIDCDCATSSDWCNRGYDCEGFVCNKKSGCGTFLLYQCNGYCYPDPTEN